MCAISTASLPARSAIVRATPSTPPTTALDSPSAGAARQLGRDRGHFDLQSMRQRNGPLIQPW